MRLDEMIWDEMILLNEWMKRNVWNEWHEHEWWYENKINQWHQVENDINGWYENMKWRKLLNGTNEWKTCINQINE